MKIRHFVLGALAGLSALLMCSCASAPESYIDETMKCFVDRNSVEDMSDDEILNMAGEFDSEQMKDEKKKFIGVALEVSFQEANGTEVKNQGEFVEDCRRYAMNYLARTRGFRVQVYPKGVTGNDLLTSTQYQKKQLPFYLSMRIILNTDIKEGYDEDNVLYKTSIEWHLIDNRTKINGLGDSDAPFIKGSPSTCQNYAIKPTAISMMGGADQGGFGKNSTAQKTFRDTLENALIEFRAQLVNKLPYGGRVSTFKLHDDVVYMTIKAGADEGIEPSMQMLIRTEDGLPVAVASATGGGKGKSTLVVWRWMSDSIKKQILSAAEDKKAAEWLDEEGNALYAVCLGMPTPRKNTERTQIKDKF